MSPTVYSLFAAMSLGALLASQAGINARLRGALGSPVAAALVSFLVGTAALLLYALATRPTLPAPDSLRPLPWWIWTGGLLGAVFVAASTVLAPRLGSTALTAAVVSGQLLTALILDHFGWAGFDRRAVGGWQVSGVAMVLAGLWMIQRR